MQADLRQHQRETVEAVLGKGSEGSDKMRKTQTNSKGTLNEFTSLFMSQCIRRAAEMNEGTVVQAQNQSLKSEVAHSR